MTATSATNILLSANAVYAPKVYKVLDSAKPGGPVLAKADLPDADAADVSTGLIYSTKGLTEGDAVPGKGITYLKDKNGDYFSIDSSKLAMVASGTGLNLYVFADDGTTEAYAFDSKGVLSKDEPTILSAQALSAIEVAAKRDLNGDEITGAKLVKNGADSGVIDATGGLYNVSIAGQDLYVVGAELGKAKALDISKSTLLNSDGSAWAPEQDYASLTAVATTSLVDKKSVTTWAVYAKDDAGQVTEFKFGADLTLSEDEPKVLTAKELTDLEKQKGRDLDSDGVYGVSIEKTEESAAYNKDGLYKGSALGQDFYLVSSSKLATATTAKTSATSMVGSLLKDDGGEITAWGLPEGYAVASLVDNRGSNKVTVDADYSLFTYKVTDGEVDKNTLLRFDFKAQTAGSKTTDYLVTSESAEGLTVTAQDLAAAEKAVKRDLNRDSVFGVKIDQPVDKVGGLFAAKALGNDFLLVGKGLTSSASKPQDLSSALLTADGEAWKPEGVAKLNNNVRIVNKDGGGYEVFVKEDGDDGANVKYTFGADFKQSGEKEELTIEQLAAAEKTYKRDLNGDSAYGVKVTDLRDAKSGLYIGEFENEKTIYLNAGNTKLDIGARVANKAADLSMALTTDEGYWNVDEGYKVKAAYTDGENYVLFAIRSSGDETSKNTNDVRKYTFADNKLVEDSSGDMNLFDLSKLEADQKRDFNGDGQVGVKVANSDTLDKVGGLHQVTLGSGEDTKTFLVQGSKANGIKDLSTALLDSEGAAWAAPEGQEVKAMVAREGGGYNVYTKDADGQYIRHSFKIDDENKIVYDDSVEDNGKVLSLIDLADDEKASSRDINGDKSAGAKVTGAIDMKGGLYEAQIGGETMTLVAASTPNKAEKLSDKVLLDSDGTSAWKVEEDYKLSAVVKEDDDSYSLYAINKSDANDIKRYHFDDQRVFTEAETLTAEDLVKAEKAADRDFNQDKAMGLAVGTAVDKKGALYKASVLGSDFYVVGTEGSVLKTGKPGGTAVDLSTALLDADGAAWKEEEGGWQVGGIVANKTGDAITSYDVYTYLKDDRDDKDAVTKVQKSSWGVKEADGVKSLDFLGTTAADLVSLVEVEKDKKRDLSGDRVVGFRTLSTVSDGYAGVTEAKVAGSVTFLLAGAKLRQGTPTNPLTIKDALLNEDGSAPWAVADGFKVKSVDDSDPDAGGKRYVYALNSDTNEVQRYTFDKTTGRVDGEATKSMTAVELAKIELSRKKDLDDDKKVAVTASEVTTVDYSYTSGVKSITKSTGLLKTSLLGQDYLVVGNKPGAGKSINLSSALLKDDGDGNLVAWAAPTDGGFLLKGVYQTTEDSKDIAEVYGVNENKEIVRFKFEKQDDETYKLLTTEQNTAGSEVVTGLALAKREATAGKDLSGDGSIGFQVTEEKTRTQSNGFSLGRAKVDTPDVTETGDDAVQVDDSPTIYIVGKSLGKMGTLASNLANNAALFSGTDAYWSPGEGEEVKNIVQTDGEDGKPNKVTLYAEKTVDDVKTWVRYNFTLQGEDTKLWTLETADSYDMSSDDMVADEASTKRDLNDDGAVGLKVTGNPATGLSQASFGGSTYFLVGNVSSGTGTRPLALADSKLLTQKDADDKDVAWKPAEGLSIKSFQTLSGTQPDGVPTDAKYKLTLEDSEAAQTVQYFDATYKALANS